MTHSRKHKPLVQKLQESTVRQEQAAVIFAVPGIAVVKEYSSVQSHEQLLMVVAVGGLYAVALGMMVRGLRKCDAIPVSGEAGGRFPWKISGSIVASVATGTLAWMNFGPGLEVTQYALGCLVLCLLSFGLDFQFAKRNRTSRQDILNQRLDTVLQHLEDADHEVAHIGDRDLYSSFNAYKGAVQKLIEAVRVTPEKAPIARRHFGPLVEGALGAGRNYLKVIQVAPNPKARAVIIEMLQRLEQEYTQAADDISAGNVENLEVEAGVLEDMLTRLRPT
ncbi:hypothetical protein K3X41_12525 [Aliiroseovarius crassostreae]|uniref:hypothetical protein n=1 Tax=Aliiroseovarius crassostreae TaxID=154981 RepID=UPI00220EA0F7|nr:hypothetical protein [Aliiroseovarius crassostreae]UWQ10697.1 hypothetical protein K3X41_12525 [Aliiroseovarius crassostreae]